MDTASLRRYLTLWLAGCAGLVALAAGANWLVDPYLLFRSPRIEGFNAVKPAFDARQRVVKPYHAAALQPATVVLGNSRAQRGYDPASPAWPRGLQPVYNMAPAGGTIWENVRFLQHAVATAPVRTVLLGIEFEEFLPGFHPLTDRALAARQAEVDERLAVDADGSANRTAWLAALKDHAGALVSLDALVDSAWTVLAQRNPEAGDISDLGFNYLREEEAVIAELGHHFFFARKARELVARYRERADRDVPGRNRIFVGHESDEVLQRLFAIAAEHGLRLVLVIQPYHVSYLDILDRAGLLEAFQDWKRFLTGRVADAGSAVELWDFSGYGPLNAEPVPPAGDRSTHMRWHVEPGHFKAPLGDKVIARVFGGAPDDFGIRLTPDSIERHLAQQRADRRRYLAAERPLAGQLRSSAVVRPGSKLP